MAEKIIESPIKPEDLPKLYYYTRRELEDGSQVLIWVYKKPCPQCGGELAKPKGKTGRPKSKAKDLMCSECGFTIKVKDYEKELDANIIYICSSCGKKGNKVEKFVRKGSRTGKENPLRFEFDCDFCEHHFVVSKLKR